MAILLGERTQSVPGTVLAQITEHAPLIQGLVERLSGGLDPAEELRVLAALDISEREAQRREVFTAPGLALALAEAPWSTLLALEAELFPYLDEMPAGWGEAADIREVA